MTKFQDFSKKVSLLVILLFIGIVVTASYGFLFKGFDTQVIFNKFSFYGILALGSALIIVSLLADLIFRIKENPYGNNVLFNSAGDKPSILPFLKKLKMPQMFLIFGLIALILSMFLAYNQQEQLYDVPTLVAQQFTPGADAVFSIILIPLAENLGLGAVIAVIAYILIRLAMKYKWNPKSFLIILIILITLFSGAYGVINHNLAYGDSDKGLFAVFNFWAVGGFLTAVTLSFIPFFMVHLVNNTVLKMQNFFSSDGIIAIMFVLTLLVMALTILSFIKKKGTKEVKNN